MYQQQITSTVMMQIAEIISGRISSQDSFELPCPDGNQNFRCCMKRYSGVSSCSEA